MSASSSFLDESKMYSEKGKPKQDLPREEVDERVETLKFNMRDNYKNLEENSRKIVKLRDHLEMTQRIMEEHHKAQGMNEEIGILIVEYGK